MRVRMLGTSWMHSVKGRLGINIFVLARFLFLPFFASLRLCVEMYT